MRSGCPHAHGKHTHVDTLLSENPQGLLVTSDQLSFICMKVRTQEPPGAGSPALPLTVRNAGSLPPQPGARWVCLCTHVSYFGMWATVEKKAEDLSAAVVTRITNRHAAHGLTTWQTFGGSNVTVAAAISSGRVTGSSHARRWEYNTFA